MKTFSLFDYRIWLTVILSVALGLLWNVFSPIFELKPILVLAIPFAALFFLLMVTKPRWVMVGIILVRPLLDVILNQTRVNTGQGDGVGIGAIFNITVILLVIFLAFYLMDFPSKIAPVYCWAFYLACMFMAVIYSPVRSESIRLWFNYLSYFALFIIPFFVVKSSQDFDFWIKILGFSFILPVFYANIDMMRGGEYFEDAGQRIEGTFTHPNILAFYLVLAFTFYFYLLKSGRLKRSPVINFGVKLLMIDILVLLIATKTRNAWVSLYAGFFIYGLLRERKTLMVLVILVPLVYFIPQVHARIATLQGNKIGDYQGEDSLEWRKEIWEGSFQKIGERPLQGWGLGSFKYMSEEFSENKEMGAHNTYLEMLFECGFIGLASFVILFLNPLSLFFKSMCRTLSQTEGKVWAIMVGYIVSYMLICCADNLLFYLVFNWYVWFFIGLMLVASYRKYPVYA